MYNHKIYDTQYVRIIIHNTIWYNIIHIVTQLWYKYNRDSVSTKFRNIIFSPATTHQYDTKIFNKCSTHDEHQCHTCSSLSVRFQECIVKFRLPWNFNLTHIILPIAIFARNGSPRICTCIWKRRERERERTIADYRRPEYTFDRRYC